MKKLMFLTMMFGLMLVFSGSVSAQNCNPNDNQIAIYVNSNYGGKCLVLNVGDYKNPTAGKFGNDVISSIKVGKNVSAMVCQDFDFKGNCQTFETNTDNLASTKIGDDEASSIKVMAKNNMAGNVGSGLVLEAGAPFSPVKGDVVSSGTSTMEKDNSDLGVKKGTKLNSFLLSHKNNIGIFLKWSAKDSDIEKILMYKKAEVYNLPQAANKFDIRRGDTFTIQMQPAETLKIQGGGTYVTFSFFRNNKSTGVISFVVK